MINFNDKSLANELFSATNCFLHYKMTSHQSVTLPIYIAGAIFLSWPIDSKNLKPFVSIILHILLPLSVGTTYTYIIYDNFEYLGLTKFTSSSSNQKFIFLGVVFIVHGMFYFFQLYNIFNRSYLKTMIKEIDAHLETHQENVHHNFTKELFFFFISAITCTVFDYYMIGKVMKNFSDPLYVIFYYSTSICILEMYLICGIIRCYRYVFRGINTNVTKLLNIGKSNLTNSKYHKHWKYDSMTIFNVTAKRHIEMVKALRCFNKLFGPVILYFVGYVFATIVANCHYICIAFMKMLIEFNVNFETANWVIIRIVLLTIFIWGMMHSWTSLTEEVRIL